LAGIDFPSPTIAFAISPKTKSDLDRLGTALSRMTEEDPTLQVTRDDATSETLIWGIGDGHLNVAVERLQSKFGAEVDVSVPQVPYKETIRRQSTADGRFKRQSGGHGQFGEVTIVLEPLPLNQGEFEFLNEIVGGAISRSYVPAVEKGIRGEMLEGILAGYPVVGCKVRLTDGKEHQVDSSDQAFQLAGALAFREAARKASPTILEPIYELKVSVPDTFTGPIISDLNSKRARVSGTDQATDGNTMIVAEIPLAEVQRYAVDLRQITQGRGSFTIDFLRYDEAPAHVQEQVIAARSKASDE
jgi:elongation factor G